MLPLAARMTMCHSVAVEPDTKPGAGLARGTGSQPDAIWFHWVPGRGPTLALFGETRLA